MLVLLLTSCSLLVRRDEPQDCVAGSLSLCDGSTLVICQSGLELRIDCSASACTPGYTECGACGDGDIQDTDDDGVVDEACDDGNAVSGDGCSTFCAVEFCGDGVVNNGGAEFCDDQNDDDLDGCADCGLQPQLQVSAGGEHTCLLNTSGEVFCTGDNASGQLGIGNTNNIGDDEPFPVLANTLSAAAARISSGAEHTCALLTSAEVSCWGSGADGRLGLGDELNIGDNEAVNAIVDLDGDAAIQVSAGGAHSCAVLLDGSVSCWGDNTSGQLGSGDNADLLTPGASRVSLGALVLQVSAGGAHTCALIEGGSVRCWGEGESGQLGNGSAQDVLDAALSTTVDLGGRAAKQIATGQAHSCALLEDGAVRCWGDNLQGQVGLVGIDKVGDDETLSQDTSIGAEAVQLTAGARHSCALLVNDGLVCWGSSFGGRLGYGNTENIGDDEAPSTAGLVDIGAGEPPTFVTGGGAHTCALRGVDAFQCWGDGRLGQLGLGLSVANLGDDEAPNSVNALFTSVTHLAVGGDHSCAVRNGNEVFCWGDNELGQLGSGDTRFIGDDEAPEALPSILLAGESVLVLSAGQSHVCALLTSGVVRCWGLGLDGRLGYGNVESVGDDEEPSGFQVALGESALKIALGESHTCAVLNKIATDPIRCWGNGASGRLGRASPDSIGDDEAPNDESEDFLNNPRQLVAGGSHSCVVLNGAVFGINDTLSCWGGNALGQLGQANTNDLNAPSDVDLGNNINISLVSNGRSHTCAVFNEGSLVVERGLVKCWGDGSAGQTLSPGLATLGDDETPAQIGRIPLAGEATLLATGSEHTCAVVNTGTQVQCWGRNNKGQLGKGDTTDFTVGTPTVSPVLAAGEVVSQIFSGESHTCALLTNGTVRCWGDNSSGQLGLDSLVIFIGDDESPANVEESVLLIP